MTAELGVGAARHYEEPLARLESLHDRRRRLQAELADLEKGIEAREEEICRALRRARARGVGVVTFGDTAYSERDGRLHAESFAPAHATKYEPDGREWREDDVVAATTGPATAEALYGSPSRDGPTLETLPRWEEEDRAC